jgi:hypothetical protein
MVDKLQYVDVWILYDRAVTLTSSRARHMATRSSSRVDVSTGPSFCDSSGYSLVQNMSVSTQIARLSTMASLPTFLYFRGRLHALGMKNVAVPLTQVARPEASGCLSMLVRSIVHMADFEDRHPFVGPPADSGECPRTSVTI